MIAVLNPISNDERLGSSIRLSDGDRVRLQDIATAAQGAAFLAEIDVAIEDIEEQLEAGISRPGDPGWPARAAYALKMKRRGRAALQHRVDELRAVERVLNKPALARRDARRKAFVNAAEELLDAEVFTEIWARAAEVDPTAFAGKEARDA